MNRVLAFGLCVCFIVPLAATADEPDFQPLSSALVQFRSGSGSEVGIRFSATSFRVMQRLGSEIEEADAKAILPKQDSIPRLKIAADGYWIEQTVDADTTLEKPVPNDREPSTKKWKKRSWTALATYDVAAWPSFVDFAVANGLCGISEERYKDEEPWLTLSFAPITPTSIDAGSRELTLTPEFAAQMRLSPKYPAHSGSNGFVILLHDPHDNVVGRYETLAGVHALASANQSVNFRFLVEGYYRASALSPAVPSLKDPSRRIDLTALDAFVKPGAQTNPAIVHRLLSRYLINTPTAYHLLYDRRLEAIAIDNAVLLRYAAPKTEREPWQQAASLSNILSSVAKTKFPAGTEKAKESFLNEVEMAYVYATADLKDLPEQQLIEYFDTLAQLDGSIASQARALNRAGIHISAADTQAVATDAANCAEQSRIFGKASDRNKTMAPLIIQAASASDKIPIAFIGSYHTQGIVNALTDAGVGYVVIEPRPRRSSTNAEIEAFNSANHVNERQAYVQSVRLNMGYVAPSVIEARQLASKIDLAVPSIRAEHANTAREFSSIAGASVDLGQLSAAASDNGSLANVRISSGGNKPPPPPNFGDAFALFDPGNGKPGGGPLLVVTDPRDSRWQEKDRYAFLGSAMFFSPGESDGFTSGQSTSMYQNPETGRMFFILYDPQSKRSYCFEGKANDVSARLASFVPAPIGANGREKDLRMQVAEILKRRGRKDG